MKRRVKKVGTFKLETDKEVEHFNEWRQFYEPMDFQKLFLCVTQDYEIKGRSLFRTLVTLFISKKEVKNDPPVEALPDVPEGDKDK